MLQLHVFIKLKEKYFALSYCLSSFFSSSSLSIGRERWYFTANILTATMMTNTTTTVTATLTCKEVISQ